MSMEKNDLSADRPDVAKLEKDVDSKRSKKSSSSGVLDPDSPSGLKGSATEAKTLLSEEQALERARQDPNDTEPIYITYGIDDHDNPRNWPKWKKWYITCFASFLNVLTSVTNDQFSRLLMLTSCPAVSVQVAYPPGPKTLPTSSMCPAKSRLSASPCTFSASPLDQYCSLLCPNTMVVIRSTSYHGFSSSYSRFPWLWHQTLGPYSSADSLRDSSVVRP